METARISTHSYIIRNVESTCKYDGISSAERVFGSSLVLPDSLLDVEEASTAELAQAFWDLSGGVPV